MPQHTRPRPICPNCDGFAAVAITTGQRTDDGQRQTLTATCRPCHGTGHRTPAAALVHAGK
ncbi:hypothetical protein OG292_19560 [Streptomyces sp. NBC_01511]|uniref:hypothetical protein n=1 Tax=Streptomyces sp. NBC_01511 TaxID=2903889 RepID=UPI003867908D